MSDEKARTWVYKQEEIFQDIPDDAENSLMTIPPEVSEAVGLVPGDTVKIEVGDKGTIIINKIDPKDIPQNTTQKD